VGIRRRIAVFQDVREQQGLQHGNPRDSGPDARSKAHGNFADSSNADGGCPGNGVLGDGHERAGPDGFLDRAAHDQQRKGPGDDAHGIPTAIPAEPWTPASQDQPPRDPAAGGRGPAVGTRRRVRGQLEPYQAADGQEGGDPVRGRYRVCALAHAVRHRAGRGSAAAGRAGGARLAGGPQSAASRR